MFRDAGNIDDMRSYARRALSDDDLQRNVLRAVRAARQVYDDLSGEAPADAARKVASPRDPVHKELDNAVTNLSEAMLRMSGRAPRRPQRSWKPFAFGAAAMFVLFNPATGPSTRKWLKDHIIGSEEEFDYQAPEYY